MTICKKCNTFLTTNCQEFIPVLEFILYFSLTRTCFLEVITVALLCCRMNSGGNLVVFTFSLVLTVCSPINIFVLVPFMAVVLGDGLLYCVQQQCILCLHGLFTFIHITFTSLFYIVTRVTPSCLL